MEYDEGKPDYSPMSFETDILKFEKNLIRDNREIAINFSHSHLLGDEGQGSDEASGGRHENGPLLSSH